jgi:hypothetical protein
MEMAKKFYLTVHLCIRRRTLVRENPETHSAYFHHDGGVVPIRQFSLQGVDHKN